MNYSNFSFLSLLESSSGVSDGSSLVKNLSMLLKSKLLSIFGTKIGWTNFYSRSSKLIFEKKGCFFNFSMPLTPYPIRFLGCLILKMVKPEKFTYILNEQLIQKIGGLGRKRRQHLNLWLCYHLQLLILVLVSYFKRIYPAQHFIDKQALNSRKLERLKRANLKLETLIGKFYFQN